MSADPNLFGSRKRRKEKNKLAKEFKNMAAETQQEIEAAKLVDPFQSASAKQAMAEASRQAKQQQQRYMNILGANASPEAMIASQQALAEGTGAAAGAIATGAEAQKQAEIAALRGQKAQELGMYGQTKASAIQERGSGWKDFFGAMGQIGGLASGVSSAYKAFAG